MICLQKTQIYMNIYFYKSHIYIYIYIYACVNINFWVTNIYTFRYKLT